MSLCDEIYDTMGLLDSSEGDESARRLMCRTAQSQLTGQLRAGLSPEDCQAAFVTAAAFLALGMLTDAKSLSGVSSFAAGDFSVSMKGGDGYRWRTMAQQLIAPYSGEGFAFVGVRA